MSIRRRSLVAAAATLPVQPWLKALADKPDSDSEHLVLTRFTGSSLDVLTEAGWRGFSDRVMGGISNASLEQDAVAGKNCLRLSGNVTTESNGGFIQMALYFGRNYAELDASDYAGIEVLLYGNDENYNVHVRTSDCGWHDESYRHTLFVPASWQRVRIPWQDFTANNINKPLDKSSLQRLALLGWMREFQADICLAEISLYS
jgi:hypothetical protein